MTIRTKIVLVVLPLILAPLVLTGVISALSARNGITSVAAGLLQFKAEQLVTYAQGQWNLLTANGLEATPAYLEASKAAIESFAKSLIRTPTETIFALGPDGSATIRSGELRTSPAEMEALRGLASAGASGWQTIQMGGAPYVAHFASFKPFLWTIVVTENAGTFYSAADSILRQAGYILGASLVAAIILLFLFARYLTRPLQQVVDAMSDIISKGDLSRRVEVLYKDETGRLGHTFNLMSEELGKAYDQIKSYALRAAVSQIKEEKIRHVFQRYVPKTVLESFFANPEQALVGENRVLAVLFSDIRGFTSISENMRADEMVESLNNYFARMVDVVMRPGRDGIVDKYIGDAVMAFFGAPERHEDDALRSVLAAFEMLDALGDFNKWQAQKGRALFRIGIGINYGYVTVGNIGSERKMDYTVIGDMVNLASRMEGLTKTYHEPIVISDSVQRKVSTTVQCRRLGTVAVKGRREGTGIYSARRSLDAAEEKAWPLHEQALSLYYPERKFAEAAVLFRQVKELLPEDHCAGFLLERCSMYIKSPPPESWRGVEEMTEK